MVTTPQLIQTKLQSPPVYTDTLPRPQLVERLNKGRHRKLTLISAPAGYGKSTLASIWRQSCEVPVAWFSLDNNDNDIYTFLVYFINAIRVAIPNACAETYTLLNGPELPPLDYLTTSLVNETANFPENLLVFIDDYHVISNNDIKQFVSSLIQHQSDKIHFVIITRHDMQGISKLRANNQISEIRINDLRFSKTEILNCLEGSLDKQVSSDVVERLAERTEGWAVGLHLACLALRDHHDVMDFLDRFKGMNIYIMRYLTDEILTRQTEHVQAFLLCTSILERFSLPLCDVLLSEFYGGNPEHDKADSLSSSASTLQLLIDGNLFVIPLDQMGQWFRYHHLFKDLLQHHLTTEYSSTQVAALHVAAGAYMEQQGYIEEAFDHYLAASAMDKAISLFTQLRYTFMNATQWQQLEHYLHRFSPEKIEQYPELLIAKIWLMYYCGQWARLPQSMQQMETLLAQSALPPADGHQIHGELDTLYSRSFYWRLQPEQAIERANSALQNIPRELWMARCLPRILKAAAMQMLGESLTNAYAVIYDAFCEESEQNNLFKALSSYLIGNIAWIDADLERVARCAKQSIEFSRNTTSTAVQGYGHSHLGIAMYMRNHLTDAEKSFSVVVQAPYLNYSDSYLYSAIGLSLTYLAQGRPDEANKTAKDLVDFLTNSGNVSLLAIAEGFLADLALQQNNIVAARQWASQFDEPPPLAPAHRNYIPHETLAKTWLYENTPTSHERAGALLSQMETFYASIHNKFYLLKVKALQALYHDMQEETDKALESLQQALMLAQSGGFIRVFVDLGPSLIPLFQEIADNNPKLQPYITQILTAYEPGECAQPINGHHTMAGEHPEEPLTNREIDILRLLAQRKANKEIAAELTISENTVKFHLKNIYTKLHVHKRRQVIDRGRALGLIPSE